MVAAQRSVYLLLGSNLSSPVLQLEKARELLARQIAPIHTASSLYRTAAWGDANQPDFINQVVVLTTDLPGKQILQKTQQIEMELGRSRAAKWGPRTIDIDILFLGQEVHRDDALTVPHPRIAERRFTLVPLSEIAPDLVHPVLQKSVQQLLHETADSLNVNRL